MVMGNVTVHDFTTLAMVLIILLVRGHAEVAAIRFSPTSPPALASPRESEALRFFCGTSGATEPHTISLDRLFISFLTGERFSMYIMQIKKRPGGGRWL